MKLIRRASVRHLGSHPGQLGLSVLGVAMGVAVVVALQLAIQSSREAFRVSTETVAGRATHHVVGGVGGLDQTLLVRLRIDLGVAAAAPVIEAVASSPALPGTALRVLGVDPFSEAPFRPYLAGGEVGGPAAPGASAGAAVPAGGRGGPFPARALDVATLMTTPRGVVMAAATARAAGVSPGDTFPLLVDGRTEALIVVGVIEPADALSRAGLRDVLVLDVASAQDVVGSEGRLSRIDLRLEGPTQEAAVRAALPLDALLETTGTRAETLEGMIAAFDLNLTALSFLALVFGMFLIYNAQTFSVVQRREMLGGLRALGVTRREVLSVVLAEAAAIGVVGSLLGVGLGIVLGRGLVGLVTRTINDLYFVVSVDGLHLPAATLLGGAALGVGATVLSSLAPALEAASTTPRLARVRSAGEEAARRSVGRAAAAGAASTALGAVLLLAPTRSLVVAFAGLFLGLLGAALMTPLGAVILVGWARPLLTRVAGTVGTMAARGVVTALSRTAPALAALVVAVGVTVGLGVMIDSFRGSLLRWLDGTLQADVYVSLPSVQASRASGTLPPSVVDALVGHADVVGHSTYRGVEVPVEGGLVNLVALDLDFRGQAAFDFLEGRAGAAFTAFRTAGAALVSEPFAYRRGIGVGDTVEVPAPRGVVSLPVAGVFYDYGSDQGSVMIARATFDAAWDDRGITSLALFLADNADVEAVVREMQAAVPPATLLSIRTNRALRRGSVEVFDRTFRVTAVLRLLAFVVAFVGVVSALTALQLERSRELGVLRASGMTPAQVGGLVTTQTGLMGLVSGVMALPVGVALAVVMIFVVNKRGFGWTLRMELGWEVALQAVGLALIGSLLAGIVPAWRMARTSPAEALRGE